MQDYQYICAETQWMPPLSFMALWMKLDVPYLMEAHENYQKRSWRNRAHILSPNGIQLLSIPLDKGKNNKMDIQEVTINYEEDWPRQHLRSIMTAYGSAPFYEHYIPEIEELYNEQPHKLWDWNQMWLDWFIQKLYLIVEIQYTEQFEKQKATQVLDLRFKDIPEDLGNYTRSEEFWYPQIFEAELGFQTDVSIIDLLMCTGPEAGTYLSRFWKKK